MLYCYTGSWGQGRRLLHGCPCISLHSKLGSEAALIIHTGSNSFLNDHEALLDWEHFSKHITKIWHFPVVSSFLRQSTEINSAVIPLIDLVHQVVLVRQSAKLTFVHFTFYTIWYCIVHGHSESAFYAFLLLIAK